MKKIMFVCTGNICRSPMAQYYMQKKIKDLKKENDFLISSCGTFAISGQAATSNAIIAMKQYNIDISKHRATNIHEIDIENYDLILCLTQEHKKNVAEIFPKVTDKLFTLKEYAFKNEKYIDIDDPWGLSLEVYKRSANEIVDGIDKIVEKM
ncbi:MAG: low molecular weight protein arginine phosphatase [Clostridia bacterium]